MDFSFSDDQLAFRDAVVDLLAKECPASVVRDAWDPASSGRAPKAWHALTEMGVLGVLAPEAAGGLGLDDIDLVLLLEATGYACLPEPIVETAAVAVPLLAARGDERAAALVGGASAALVHPLAPRAVWADSARVVVFASADGVGVAEHDRDRDPLDLVAVTSVDGARRLFEVAPAPDAEADSDSDAAARAFDRAANGTAAQLCGLAQRMIDMSVAYAKERRQFGVPIGSFQAVKHHLANARLALEFARPIVYRAAWTIATAAPDCGVAVSLAKASASDAASLAARVALQCHGAIGYTTEYDLHLFMKRTWALAATWGDAAWHRGRVQRAILSPGSERGNLT